MALKAKGGITMNFNYIAKIQLTCEFLVSVNNFKTRIDNVFN